MCRGVHGRSHNLRNGTAVGGVVVRSRRRTDNFGAVFVLRTAGRQILKTEVTVLEDHGNKTAEVHRGDNQIFYAQKVRAGNI